MDYLFPDQMFAQYGASIPENEAVYEYRWYEADGFNVGERGWRKTLEGFAQEKLAKLSQQDPAWEPFVVIRDSIIGTDSEPEPMRPLAFSFRRKKVLPIPVC